ncbi:MAG: NAD-dependent epimerase/dehydratase family protein [Saprospiraceae bacterium]|nr:NAD-dependent epimerase/dehydratase family protein [Saprospiraceae bacterium]
MKVIITGSTGMVGKAVVIECLEDEEVQEVLVINRNKIDITHSKLKEVIVTDFDNIADIKNVLQGYDACFHCMGISAIGKSEEDYDKITFGYTKSLVDLCFELNPNMVFNYVSGKGTDSTEKGNTMWARVKGKTENYILGKGFKDAYMFRPGAILPEKGVKSKTGWYNAIYVVMRPFFPLMYKMNSITSSSNLGKAMINSLRFPQTNKHLENPEINSLANRKQ